MKRARSEGSEGDAAEVVELAVRQLVSRSGEALTVGAALTAAAALRDGADQRIFELVDFARRSGASWAAIAEALGVTTQAAHQRYGASKDRSGAGQRSGSGCDAGGQQVERL